MVSTVGLVYGFKPLCVHSTHGRAHRLARGLVAAIQTVIHEQLDDGIVYLKRHRD